MAAMKGRDLARQGIAELEIFQSGKSFAELKKEHGVTEIIRLSANENPLGTSPKAAAAMKEAVDQVYLYPDSKSGELRQKVAAMFGITEDMIVFGNGADNILLMIAQAFLNPGDEAVIADPTFGVYETVIQMMGGQVVKVPLREMTHDLEAMAARITPRTKLVIVCNPNNPTGTIVSREQVAAFLDRVPDHCIVVFDEAYAEFVTDPAYPNTVDYLAGDRNVLVIRTFSKVFGLAGSRVGYAMGPQHLVDILWRAAEPFPVNRLAQAGALAALDDQDFLRRTVAVSEEGKAYLYDAYGKLGMTCVPSATNFIFVDLAMDSRQAAQQLLAEGIIISSGYNWDLPTSARITIGTRAQNEKLIAALGRIKAGN